MIAFVKGKVRAITLDSIVVENNGIGYRIKFNQTNDVSLDDDVLIYTYMHVREDEMSLYGFLSLEDYELFIKLITVKGLGPKTCSSMISFGKSNRIIEAIETNDVAFIKSLPGVGSKTASQIILDLKGKLVKEDNNISDNSNIKDAIEALKALGYKANELSFLNKEFRKEELSCDEYIKLGLQLLAKKRG